MRFPCPCGSGQPSWLVETSRDDTLARICMRCIPLAFVPIFPEHMAFPLTDPDYGQSIPLLDLD